MYDKNTGKIVDPAEVAVIITMLGLGALLFAILGILILRALRSHNSKGSYPPISVVANPRREPSYRAECWIASLSSL